jgi:hypothetical protein
VRGGGGGSGACKPICPAVKKRQSGGATGDDRTRSPDCPGTMTRQSGVMQGELKFREVSTIRPVRVISPDSPVVNEILTEPAGSSRT